MATVTAESAPPDTIGRPGPTMAITSLAAFMVSLDQLVVTTALPTIRDELHTDITGVGWVVNAYTLTFAVLLLTAAAVADRFGRRRLFCLGLGLFTAASAAAALSTGIGALIAARALQGLGAAIVLPLTLTILSAAFPPQKRGAALGAWGAVAGLAVACGPVVGGFLTGIASWQWIFWINVPIGVVLLAFAVRGLTESHGASGRLDLVGTGAISLGLLGVVFAIVRGPDEGWASAEVLASGLAGLVLIAGFFAWEARTASPMLPLRLFRNRTFSVVNALSLLMFFGMFGSIFLVTQYLQTVQGSSPLGAGVKMLSWTGMVLFAAPLGGALSDKIGGRPILLAALGLQSLGLLWLALFVEADTSYAALVPAFVCNGIGMGLYFGPTGNIVMGAVQRAEEGIASGANNAIRELGGVLGVAVLTSVFAAYGSVDTDQQFADGLVPALWLGMAVVAAGAVTAALLPGRRAADPATGTATEPTAPAAAEHSAV
ncbi:DHA2 family efflux MFS transporter permease subunit [Streptomyces sp. NPDC014733]|uniref:DHA2 family efflux MFS transporter permease subunit n=1 Tax=Streptomyces sp. NPDC014733 TaxID=3364885 RepID=UPI0036FDF493